MSDEWGKKLFEIIAASAYAAWSMSLQGGQSAEQKYYFERMGKPVPGDLVFEVTAGLRPANKYEHRIGRLVSVTQEPYPWTQEEIELNGEEPPSRDIWTIRLMDGTEFRWENCKFIVVPESVLGHQGRLPENLPRVPMFDFDRFNRT